MGDKPSDVNTAQRYQAHGSVRAGGFGRLQSHGLDAEFDATAGRLDDLPGPADLLSAALCACILKNVERFSQRFSFRYESATVEVTAEREHPPPRIVRVNYQLRIVTDETPARVALIHKNIRMFGTITNTLAAACELSGTIEAITPGTQGEPTA